MLKFELFVCKLSLPLSIKSWIFSEYLNVERTLHQKLISLYFIRLRLISTSDFGKSDWIYFPNACKNMNDQPNERTEKIENVRDWNTWWRNIQMRCNFMSVCVCVFDENELSLEDDSGLFNILHQAHVI